MAYDTLAALPLGAATRIQPSTLAALLLLKVELQRVAAETEQSRQTFLATAAEGVDGFAEGIDSFIRDPDAHPDFEPVFARVNERFAPVYGPYLAEEVETHRPLLTAAQFADLCGGIDLADTTLTLRGKPVAAVALLDLAASLLTDPHTDA